MYSILEAKVADKTGSWLAGPDTPVLFRTIAFSTFKQQETSEQYRQNHQKRHPEAE
jgi:hypothetical protein